MKNMMMGWIVSMIVCSVGIGTLAQTAEEWAQKERAWKEKAKDAYVFPVRPGMREWTKFQTNDEMLAACQIPENILNTMSTRGLVETCLNYPLLDSIGFSNTFQEGFDHIVTQFNGLQELLKRQDVGVALLERYATMDPETIYTRWETGQGETFFFTFLDIEILLAQTTILSSMPQQSKETLLQESLRVFHAKQRLVDYYSHISLELPVVTMAKILEQVEDPSFKRVRMNLGSQEPSYRQFLQQARNFGLNEAMLDMIVQNAEQYLITIQQGGNHNEK